MVAIRLMRTGKRNRPFYRIVVQDSRRKTDGGCLETLGTYDPRGEGSSGLAVNLERVKTWRAQGASLSDTVRALVKRASASS